MGKNYLSNFFKYVTTNMIGTLGFSIYIFADTYFMSYYAGPLGLTALNIAIPIYGLIFSFAYMIGVGGGINFSYSLAKKEYEKANEFFSISISYAFLVGVLFSILGILFSKDISRILGANAESLEMTNTYIKTVLSFGPVFLLSTNLVTFLRYDNNPNLAMVAMLSSSFFNILADYIFMEYLNLSVFGAALATGISPIVSILISLKHIFKKEGILDFKGFSFKIKKLFQIARLGVSSAIYEISQGLVTLAFNYLILGISGNIGIASYGIITNIGAIVMSMFSGLQQGIQPLISYAHGKKDTFGEKKYFKYGIIFGLALSLLVYVGSILNLDTLISIFNSQNVRLLYELAKSGMILYFLGFIPHGLNISLIAYKNATNNPRISFILSIARGSIFSLLFAFLLSHFFGMTGIWLSFPLAELATLGLYGIFNKIVKEKV